MHDCLSHYITSAGPNTHMKLNGGVRSTVVEICIVIVVAVVGWCRGGSGRVVIVVGR